MRTREELMEKVKILTRDSPLGQRIIVELLIDIRDQNEQIKELLGFYKDESSTERAMRKTK